MFENSRIHFTSSVHPTRQNVHLAVTVSLLTHRDTGNICAVRPKGGQKRFLKKGKLMVAFAYHEATCTAVNTLLFVLHDWHEGSF